MGTWWSIKSDIEPCQCKPCDGFLGKNYYRKCKEKFKYLFTILKNMILRPNLIILISRS